MEEEGFSKDMSEDLLFRRRRRSDVLEALPLASLSLSWLSRATSLPKVEDALGSLTSGDISLLAFSSDRFDRSDMSGIAASRLVKPIVDAVDRVPQIVCGEEGRP